MTRVAWTRPALAHLREIAEYITRDSPRAARTVVQSIRIGINLTTQDIGHLEFAAIWNLEPDNAGLSMGPLFFYFGRW